MGFDLFGLFRKSEPAREPDPVHSPDPIRKPDAAEELWNEIQNAVTCEDYETIEGLRDRDVLGILDRVIALYEQQETWSGKDCIINVVQDIRDSRLEPMMKDTLNSTMPEGVAIALVWLQGDDALFDEMMTNFFVDPEKVQKQLQIYRSRS